MGAAKQRQAVAPYALPLAIASELSGMIDDRQSHFTGTYLGMAQVGANNSGTGAIRRLNPSGYSLDSITQVVGQVVLNVQTQQNHWTMRFRMWTRDVCSFCNLSFIDICINLNNHVQKLSQWQYHLRLNLLPRGSTSVRQPQTQ